MSTLPPAFQRPIVEQRQIVLTWDQMDHILGEDLPLGNLLHHSLGAASKPNRRLTGGSVRFRAVVFV